MRKIATYDTREMKTLEFRVWDKEKKEHYPVIELDWDEDGLSVLWEIGNGLSTMALVDDDIAELEQYTGFKDEECRKIFEGDILVGPDGSLTEVISNPQGHGFVIYDDKVIGKEWLSRYFLIVGNIHKNTILNGELAPRESEK